MSGASHIIGEQPVDIDLSSLISFSLTFQPLQLALQAVQSRLDALEQENASKSDQIAKLTEQVQVLQGHDGAVPPKSRSRQESHRDSDGKLGDQLSHRSSVNSHGRPVRGNAHNTSTGATNDANNGDNNTNNDTTSSNKISELRHAGKSVFDDSDTEHKSDVHNHPHISREELNSLWTEVYHLKHIVGKQRPAQARPSVADFYAARARKASDHSLGSMTSSAVAPLSGKSAVLLPGKGSVSPLWGDVILTKASEALPLEGSYNSAAVVDDNDNADSTAANNRAGGHLLRSMTGDAGESMQPQELQQRQRPQSQAQSPPTTSLPLPHSVSSKVRGTRGPSSFSSRGDRPSSPDDNNAAASAEGAAAAASNATSFAQSKSVAPSSALPLNGQSLTTLSDVLMRDNRDITYLNRVVAEILGEMQTLHSSVGRLGSSQSERYVPSHGLIRKANDNTKNISMGQEDEATDGVFSDELSSSERRQQDNNDNSNASLNAHGATTDAMPSLRNRDGILRRIESLEVGLEKVDRASQHRDNALRSRLDSLQQQHAHMQHSAQALTDSINNTNNNCGNNNVNDLQSDVRELQQKQSRLDSKLSSILEMPSDPKQGSGGATEAVQIAVMQGSLSNVEKQLDEMRRELGEVSCAAQEMRQNSQQQRNEGKDATGADVAGLLVSVSALRRDVETLQSDLHDQADQTSQLQRSKADRDELEQILLSAESQNRIDSADMTHRLAPVQERLDALQSQLYCLDTEKASQEDLQRLISNLNNLKILMEINAKRDSASASSLGDGEPLSQELDRILRDMQQQIISQEDRLLKQSDASRDSLEELRDMLEQLDHRKADATLVANKAERDYVENALERLMREVEQVLNATNAGLIDTLDKSLNILRDMMDGKATKQDVLNLQHRMNDEEADRGAADALTGFKGYRCLGCNRPVDNLRPRPLPGRPVHFMNRNTQNLPQDGVTRAIQQQQQSETLLEQHRAPRSTANSTHTQSQQGRGGHKNPLPLTES